MPVITVDTYAVLPRIQALDSEIEKAALFIAQQFNWAVTPEGSDFWAYVARRLNEAFYE